MSAMPCRLCGTYDHYRETDCHLYEKTRIGTFNCWLWGHKFLARFADYDDDGFIKTTWGSVTQNCVRCGIDRPSKEE